MTAEGFVLESRKIEKTDQKNCTVLIQRGNLNVGDIAVIGENFCKIKLIKDDRN